MSRVVGAGALGASAAERAQSVVAQRPAGPLRGNPPTASQNVAGNGEFMGRRADVVAGVVQHQVFEMHQLAVDPQRGAGVSKMGSFDPSAPHVGTGNTLVEPRQGAASLGDGQQQGGQWQLG
ncbi:hypothetical protein AMC90_PA00005 (plasmid) [Rhizobium phaseoli]|nr:hypothetical protein AMC90_PA00005 [Rhizobium phaseoli]